MSSSRVAPQTSEILTLSVAEASEATGLPERTIRHFISTRQIPFIKLGNLVRLRPADLATWVEANTHAPRR